MKITIEEKQFILRQRTTANTVGSRVIVNLHTIQDPEYFVGTVVSDKAGKLRIEFDDGDMYTIRKNSKKILPANQKRRKSEIPASKLHLFVEDYSVAPPVNTDNPELLKHKFMPYAIKYWKKTNANKIWAAFNRSKPKFNKRKKAFIFTDAGSEITIECGNYPNSMEVTDIEIKRSKTPKTRPKSPKSGGNDSAYNLATQLRDLVESSKPTLAFFAKANVIASKIRLPKGIDPLAQKDLKDIRKLIKDSASMKGVYFTNFAPMNLGIMKTLSNNLVKYIEET